MRRASESWTADVHSDDAVGLVYVAAELWGSFFGAKPVSGCDERTWARLEALTYFLTSAVEDPTARTTLREQILRAAREALRLIEGLALEPARRRLDRIARAFTRESADRPDRSGRSR